MRTRAFIFFTIFHLTDAGCPFGNPFYFLETPNVSTVRSATGDELPDRVRISWGRVKNFKCVDYFQVEYYEHGEESEEHRPRRLTEKINRHQTFLELEINPCTDYTFRVLASEDWQGMREDFKVSSDLFNFRVETVPEVLRPPSVREQRAGRGLAEVLVRVRWSLEDLAWAECLREMRFDYHDLLYNESLYSRTPAPDNGWIDFTVPADRIPCHQDFQFVVKVEGVTGGESYSTWTPPSCMMISTTTTTPKSTSPLPAIDRVRRENIQLKQKIESLKQDYHPIGRQVYSAIKESFISGFESFFNKKKILEGGNIAEIEKMLTAEKDPFLRNK